MNKNIIIFLLQIIIIKNAQLDGWSIRKVDHKTIELSKKNIQYDDINLNVLLNNLVTK